MPIYDGDFFIWRPDIVRDLPHTLESTGGPIQWVSPDPQFEQVTDFDIVPPVAGEQRLRINKKTQYWYWDKEAETEETADFVIKPIPKESTE